ncbi:MAG: hypothetical protein QXU18_00340 [Thermoplasmatales archaeon]
METKSKRGNVQGETTLFGVFKITYMEGRDECPWECPGIYQDSYRAMEIIVNMGLNIDANSGFAEVSHGDEGSVFYRVDRLKALTETSRFMFAYVGNFADGRDPRMVACGKNTTSIIESLSSPQDYTWTEDDDGHKSMMLDGELEGEIIPAIFYGKIPVEHKDVEMPG